jgi:long-chain acyl-CoA synthetase
VFHKLRELLGGRTRFLVSGGAPLSPEIARFFYGVGITVYEGYGLTEASPVISCNSPGHTRLGTVGRPLPQVEVKIAEDGEICARGPNIMKGYYNKPEETAQIIDAEGWLHTGDIGTIDSDGYVAITDRKKDFLIPSNGENVAPQPIEGQLKQDPLIEEVCLIGDKRPTRSHMSGRSSYNVRNSVRCFAAALMRSIACCRNTPGFIISHS